MGLCASLPAHIHTLLWQKGVREEFGEKAGELADHDGGDMGARPQGSLSTSLRTAERWLSGVYGPCECLNGCSHAGRGMVLESCSLCSSRTKIPYSLYKCYFHGTTLEQSASLNGNIATYTTVRKQLKNPNNLLQTAEFQSSLKVQMVWAFPYNFCVSLTKFHGFLLKCWVFPALNSPSSDCWSQRFGAKAVQDMVQPLPFSNH